MNEKELKVRSRDLRVEINALATADDADLDKLREMRNEYTGIETRLAALDAIETAAVDDEEGKIETREEGDAEARELRELRDRVRVGNYMTAALEMRSAVGAELELNQAVGLGAHQFPLELLAPELETRAPELETRETTGVTTAVTQRRWLDRLFADTAAAALGVTFESVPAGVANYPVTTAGAAPVQRGRKEVAGDAPWTVGVSEIKPTRNAARMLFTMEDSARLPGLEEALRRDLRMAMTEKIDRTVFLGDSGASENAVTGLISAADVVEKSIVQNEQGQGAPNAVGVPRPGGRQARGRHGRPPGGGGRRREHAVGFHRHQFGRVESDARAVPHGGRAHLAGAGRH